LTKPKAGWEMALFFFISNGDLQSNGPAAVVDKKVLFTPLFLRTPSETVEKDEFADQVFRDDLLF
jgi:hypothetical protein